jgi:hypothetical protein
MSEQMTVRIRDLQVGDYVLLETGAPAYRIELPLLAEDDGTTSARVRWRDGGEGRRWWNASDLDHEVMIER